MKLLLGEFSPKAKKHKNSSPPLYMPHYTEIEDSMLKNDHFCRFYLWYVRSGKSGTPFNRRCPCLHKLPAITVVRSCISK